MKIPKGSQYIAPVNQASKIVGSRFEVIMNLEEANKDVVDIGNLKVEMGDLNNVEIYTQPNSTKNNSKATIVSKHANHACPK